MKKIKAKKNVDALRDVYKQYLSELRGERSNEVYNEKMWQIFYEKYQSEIDEEKEELSVKVYPFLSSIAAYIKTDKEDKNFIQYFGAVFEEVLKREKNSKDDALKQNLKELLIKCLKFDTNEVYENEFCYSFLCIFSYYYESNDVYESALPYYQKIYNRLSKLKQRTSFARFYERYGWFLSGYCLNIPLAVDLFHKALETDPQNEYADLDLGYVYSVFSEQLCEKASELECYMLAEKHFQKSFQYACIFNIGELSHWKEQLVRVRKLIYSTPLEFMNANCDLTQLFTQLEKKKHHFFSMLIEGAQDNGKMVFAEKLLDKLKVEYKVISLYDKSSLEQLSTIKDSSEKDTGYIFQYREPQGDEDKNALTFEHIYFALKDIIENSSSPVIFIVDGAKNIQADFKNLFMFRVCFKCMNALQKEKAFELLFNQKAPKDIQTIDNLVFGDFVKIRYKAELLDCMSDTQQLCKLLKEEAELKADGCCLSGHLIYRKFSELFTMLGQKIKKKG